jgi:hypothetical protein
MNFQIAVNVNDQGPMYAHNARTLRQAEYWAAEKFAAFSAKPEVKTVEVTILLNGIPFASRVR